MCECGKETQKTQGSKDPETRARHVHVYVYVRAVPTPEEAQKCPSGSGARAITVVGADIGLVHSGSSGEVVGVFSNIRRRPALYGEVGVHTVVRRRLTAAAHVSIAGVVFQACTEGSAVVTREGGLA